MTANIFGDRFYNRGTEPAWHKLGHNFDGYMTATEAFERNPFEVWLEPVYTRVGTAAGHDNTEIQLDYVIPIRGPVEEDDQVVPLGEPVAEGYTLVTPRESCQIWDENILDIMGKPKGIETLGVLAKGRRLFITTRASVFDVGGDECKNYMFFHSPCAGNEAATIGFTTVRIVCQNTLRMAIRGATSKTILRHNTDVKSQMASWLRRMWETETKIVAVARIDMEAMTKRRVNDEEAKWLISRIIKDPIPIEKRKFALTPEAAEKVFAADMDRVVLERSNVFNLWAGMGVGADSPAAAGTLFGVYSAVAELEDNLRTRGNAAGLSILVGERGAVVERAYSTALDFLKPGFSAN